MNTGFQRNNMIHQIRWIQFRLSWMVTTIVMCLLAISCSTSSGSSSDQILPGVGHTFQINVDELKRDYILYVPTGFDYDVASPLVMMLHGGGGSAKAAIWATGWTDKADEEGFLVVFPNAIPPNPERRASFARNPRLWNDGSNRFHREQNPVDDIRFISRVIEDVQTRLQIDPHRIYVTGFSNGASMTFLVGARLSSLVSAIAPVAGACWEDDFVLDRPISMFYITGNVDPLNPIEGGVPSIFSDGSDTVRAKPKPPVRDSIKKWVKVLTCDTFPVEKTTKNGVMLETYGQCLGDTTVSYVEVDGMGHTWAGGKSILPERVVGPMSDKINATDMIWNFFNR